MCLVLWAAKAWGDGRLCLDEQICSAACPLLDAALDAHSPRADHCPCSLARKDSVAKANEEHTRGMSGLSCVPCVCV